MSAPFGSTPARTSEVRSATTSCQAVQRRARGTLPAQSLTNRARAGPRPAARGRAVVSPHTAVREQRSRRSVVLSVAFPAKGDTSLGSVGQWFGPASICAVPDLITDVSALTSAHTLAAGAPRDAQRRPRGGVSRSLYHARRQPPCRTSEYAATRERGGRAAPCAHTAHARCIGRADRERKRSTPNLAGTQAARLARTGIAAEMLTPLS
jgi:hypothetical protein